MATPKRPRAELLGSWIKDFDFLEIISDTEINCKICSKTFKCLKKSRLTAHLNTAMHRDQPSTSTDSFYTDLCKAFVAANIPFRKLDNPVLRQFLAKYTFKHIPDESSLRKTYLPKIYNEVMDKIKNEIKDHYFWISADETTDLLGRGIINIIIGVLHPDIPTEPYLIATKVIEHVNANKVVEIIVNAVDNIFDGDVNHEKALLFVSDAAAYMIKAGKLLKEKYPNILHHTCTAHALHRVAEFIREEFPNVNELISSTKKIFLKAPTRISLYKQKCPSLPLPPSPVVTRWGTWLEACSFYFNNLENVANVVNALEEDAQSIIKCKTILNDSSLKNNLNFIHEHFSNLPKHIEYFEMQAIKLEDGIKSLDNILNNFKQISGEFGVRLNNKIEAVFARSPDFNVLKGFCSNVRNTGIDIDRYIKFKDYYHYAPLTSSDVERSFSIFKDILSNKRTHFTEINLEYIVVINVNKKCLL